MRFSRHITLLLPLVLLTGLSRGSILYSGVQNIAIPADFTGVYVDFNDPNDATSFTTNTTGSGSWDINFFLGGFAVATSDTFQPVTDSTLTNANIVDVGPALAGSIDGSDNYPSGFSGSLGHMAASGGDFASGTEGYMGFRIDNGMSGFNYGWMRVTFQDDGNPGTLHDWAWEDSGGAIGVGAVPEPGSAGVTGLVLVACAVWHRRRRKERTVATVD